MNSVITYPIRGEKLSLNVSATGKIISKQSPYQTIEIFETEVFGKILLLDNHIQLTEYDENAYHECLVQIPLLNINEKKTALVVGGGDGGVLRELCKHPFELIDMVEIDEEVVALCKEYLPELNGGAFDDSRVRLHYADAFKFVKQTNRKYDFIVLDCTDVYEESEGELSEMLFTEGFYRDCKTLLSPNGVVVAQADNPWFCPYSLESILAEFGKVFPNTGSYTGLTPSFGGASAFCWGALETVVRYDEPALENSKISNVYLNPATYKLAFQPVVFHSGLGGNIRQAN